MFLMILMLNKGIFPTQIKSFCLHTNHEPRENLEPGLF